MQSSNPVFARSETFNGRTTYPGSGPSSGYGNPASWSVGTPGTPGTSTPTYVTDDRITIDSVVQKTAITLALLVASAAATWFLIGDVAGIGPEVEDNLGRAQALMIGGALLAFGLSMVNSFKRLVSPPLVMAYAVVQGVAVGAISKVFETFYDGVVLGAVVGTIAAFAGTLAAYKVLDIQVTDKFRRGVVAAMFGFVGVAMLDFVLSFFGADFGFNGFGTLGLITSVVGVVLGVLMLILDFDYVEKAVAAGAPERESWRAAFGLTVTIVWIYIEMLRILAILRGND